MDTVCAKSVVILGTWGIPWEIDVNTLKKQKEKHKKIPHTPNMWLIGNNNNNNLHFHNLTTP
jgi:hypothetical protein